MKKLLSVLFAVCLCLTAFPYAMFASAETVPITTYDIDLTQDPEPCLYGYNDSTSYSATAVVKGSKLEITVNDTKTISTNSEKWYSNYGLRNSDGAIKSANGDTVLVNVVYKVTDFTSGLTLGIGAASGINGKDGKTTFVCCQCGRVFKVKV